MEQDQDYGASLPEPLTNNDLNSLLSKTLEGYSQQKPTMVWNTTKKTWDYLQEETLFEQWEPFLGTWQTSGMMHDGKVYELAMPVQHINDSGYSSLPTPTVFHTSMHDEPIETFLEREQRSSTGQIGKSLGVAVRMEMLPTPVASEGTKAPAQQTSETKSKTGQVWLSNAAKDMELSWGKFEPAIRRWESVIGRPAPAPTKPDGKDGNHRLSSHFTEWMMGVPNGWITNCGLTRNQELKACGNGVVPQQAELALRIMLNLSNAVDEEKKKKSITNAKSKRWL